MSSRKTIPAALEPYFQLRPETSLLLLTGTLACSANWLVARFVGHALSHGEAGVQNGAGPRLSVLLVSWLRDVAFWGHEVRRATGIDVAKKESGGQFAFVDYLSTPATSQGGNAAAGIENRIRESITNLHASSSFPILLVLESPDTLLATGDITAQDLQHVILSLRSSSAVHSTLLSCSADSPFLAAATPSPPHAPLLLDTECARFLTQQAHAARLVMGVRELPTGSARDVSGVLRVTRGGCADDYEDEDRVAAGQQAARETLREMECLYLVQRDGGVKVFERGAEAGV